MREIKFRAWHPLTKEIIQPDRISSRGLNQNPLEWHSEHKWKLMQFTGLKDCEGTEIYEGDTLVDIEVELEEGVKLEDTQQQVYWCEKDGAWKLGNTFSQNKKEGWLLGKELRDFKFKVFSHIHNIKE